MRYSYANNYSTTLSAALFGSTTLTSALASGTQYSSLSVAALDGPVAVGDILLLTHSSSTQQVTVATAAASGATTVAVSTFTANAAYAATSTTVAAYQSAIAVASLTGAPAVYPYTISLTRNGATGPNYSPYEVVVITASGTALRAQEGTAAGAWAAGDTAQNDWTAMAAMGLAGVVTPQQYGGKPDGVTDNTAAMTAAIAAAAATGQPVYMSPGTWLFTGGGSGIFIVPSNVEIAGTWQANLEWTNSGSNLFKLANGTSNVKIHHLSFTSATGGSVVIGGQNYQIYIEDNRLNGCIVNSLYSCVDCAIRRNWVNGALTEATLTTALVAGDTYTSLAITSLGAAMSSGERFPIFDGNLFQNLVTSAAASVGATSISVNSFIANQSWPVGTQVQKIIGSTGLQMNGDYELWSTAPVDSGAWCVRSTISDNVVVNFLAACIFINMGYLCTVENNRCSVGHDMCLDFEYCLMCSMVGNTCEYGGSRGIAMESVNSKCSVTDNVVSYAFQDGIRVTTDDSPSGNPYDNGGHVVSGNNVWQCNSSGAGNGGICLQGVSAEVTDNDVSQCPVAGINWYDGGGGPIGDNRVYQNYGVGIVLENVSAIPIGDNVIYDNGNMGFACATTAPTLSLGNSASQLVNGESYMVAYAWQGAPTVGGVSYSFIGSPSLPAYVTMTAVDQTIDLAALTFPTEATGVAIYVAPASYFNNLTYKAAAGWEEAALLANGFRLGVISTSGAITYVRGATSGLAATVSAGAVTVTVSAPAAMALANPASALTLSQAAGSSSLAEATYYVAAWEQSNGGTTKAGSSQASIAVSAAGNTIGFTYTVQPGSEGIAVAVGEASGPLELGFIAPDGTITYSGTSSTGLAVSMVGLAWTVTISAAASATGASEPAANTTQSGTTMFNDFSICAGIWYNYGTGAISQIGIDNTIIHDNGYAGIYGATGDSPIDNCQIYDHTAFSVVASTPSGVPVSIAHTRMASSYQGVFAGAFATQGIISLCQFNGMTDSCIRMEPSGGIQTTGYSIIGNAFANSGTGIYVDATFPRYSTSRPPSVASGNTFQNVTTPINTNGGTYNVILAYNNPGLQPAGWSATTPAIPAANTYLQNASPYTYRIYSTGGSNLTIEDMNGNAKLLPQVPGEITLDPWAQLKWGTVPSSWDWYGA